MLPMLPPRRGLALLVLCALAAFPVSAQRLGDPKRQPPPAARPPTPPPPAERAETPDKAPRPLAPGLRGAPSKADENEGAESDPAFDPKAVLRSARTVPAATAAAALRLADHPRRDELAKWVVDALRDKEIDVALLGGHKYMINDCLGIKASAGTFRLKLEDPTMGFENSGIVLRFGIDHVSMSALKIRMRPNPNPLELCKFGKKFEVGGAMDDVRLTLRLDPLYDLERCRVGLPNDLNPEVRIGNLNLKPLQNDLDRMAKNMIEDSLTFALQVQSDGMLSALGDLVFSAVDQFLEADCPTQHGDTGRALADLGRATGLGGSSSAGGGGSSGGGKGGPGGAAPSAPGSTWPAPGDSAGESGSIDQDLAQLLARLEALEERIAELESAGVPATDLAGLLQQLLEQSGALGAGEAQSPEVQDLLAQLLASLFASSGAGDVQAWLDELGRDIGINAGGGAAPAEAGAAEDAANSSAGLDPWYLVPNPELKGRMGRIVVRFPDAELAGETPVAVMRDGKKVTDRWGDAAWELLPGLHDVHVTNAPVTGCEVRSGHDTLVRVGMLQVELGGETQFRVFRKGGADKLYDHWGSATIGLPTGEYEVEIQDQRAVVAIRDGEVTRF